MSIVGDRPVEIIEALPNHQRVITLSDLAAGERADDERLARQLGGKLTVADGAGTGAVFQLRLKDRC